MPRARRPFRSVVASLLPLVLAVGCASVDVTPLDAQAPIREEVRDRSYRLGEVQQVYVGQPIVAVKTYRVSRRASASVRASEDFALVGADFRIAGRKGEEFPVRGFTEIDGVRHHVVPIAGFEFFVAADGTVHRDVKTARYKWNISSKARMEPETARLVPQDSEEVTTEGEYANYELIYGGSDGDKIQATYREFAPGDASRPTFFQSLSYDAGADVIRYRDLVIEVLEASNQSISFKVVADGS
jgi:hypothetical protein